jgi:ABC-type Mn2+/Zn2+ transport system ATPase subunit
LLVTISSVAQDLEKVETTIALMKAKLKNSKDVQEIERILAELEALEWLQSQIAVFSHGDNNKIVLG